MEKQPFDFAICVPLMGGRNGYYIGVKGTEADAQEYIRESFSNGCFEIKTGHLLGKALNVVEDSGYVAIPAMMVSVVSYKEITPLILPGGRS